MRCFSASSARLKRSLWVSLRLHSLLNAPIRTTAPSLRSEKELTVSLRIRTFFPLASSSPTTQAIVTVSGKGTVSDEAGRGTGVEKSPLPSAAGSVGGPLGTSPTVTSTGPGVSSTGFQNSSCAVGLDSQRYPTRHPATKTKAQR